MLETSKDAGGRSTVVLEEKDAADWIYRGEGAVNLVLAYNGSSPDFVGKVIRIQKAPRREPKCTSDTSVLSTFECLLWKEIIELASSTSKEIAAQLFVLHVMRPLLGSEHVDDGMRVIVARKFLESIENNVRCQRPAWRVDAAKVDTLRDSALVITDHSVFPHGAIKERPCISVEIKPKCGFVPCSKFISERNAIKRSINRFRMHQVFKLHEGEISRISDYDPLDLFSGSINRIHEAIKALFTTPQNNFRIFWNGSLIFGGLGGGTDNTTFVGSEALEDSIDGLIQVNHGQRTASFLQMVSETIFRSEVLNRLLEAQKLDLHDIEGAIHAYYNIVSQPCKVCRDLGDDKSSSIYSSLHSLTFKESLKIVRDYLIAATAKDCSLMISFRLRENGDPDSSHSIVCLETTNQTFEYKANFIDLDMKPLQNMLHYYELDQKIVRCYTEMERMKNEPSDSVNSGETPQLQ